MTTLKSLLAGAALMASTLTAMAQDNCERWIDVVNRSSVTIERFYMTDVGTNSWGPDLLGDAVVRPGQRMRVEPTGRQQARGFHVYDMKVVFANGAEVERRRVNLCQATAIVCSGTNSCSVTR